MDIRTDVVERQPAEIAALLQTIADAAAGFGDQLDTLRGRYPARELHSADPLAVTLDQAGRASRR